MNLYEALVYKDEGRKKKESFYIEAKDFANAEEKLLNHTYKDSTLRITKTIISITCVADFITNNYIR